MLVLTRKESERIRIGDDIVITVVRTAGDKVRLGIEAPADVLVLRDELKPVRLSKVVKTADAAALERNVEKGMISFEQATLKPMDVARCS